MFNLMRVHQRKLWLAITIVLILSFISFYSLNRTPPGGALGADVFVHVYDRNLSRSDFGHEAQKFSLAITLGLTDYAGTLSGGSEEGAGEFALNAIIIDHEGRKLGIDPSDKEIQDALMAMPAFQTGGQFDSVKYAKITQDELGPHGLTAIDLDNLVRNSLVFDRIKKILDSVPALTDVEAGFQKRVFQPVNGLAVIFDAASFAKNARVTDAEIADYFKANSARFVTPEWRTARYVSFPLPADTSKLEGKAKIDAQQKVADASDSFATRAATEGFEKAAAESNLKIETTLPFDRTGNIKPIAGLDAAAAAGPAQALAPAVFTLSRSAPVSGVIQSGNDFLVAELGDVTPARPRTLDETRTEIVQQLTATATQAALEKAAAGALSALRAAVKSGKPFAQAVAAAGLKTQPFANLSRADETAPPDQRKYADAATALDENEISGFHPEGSGGYAVWLEKRLPVDQKKFGDRGTEYLSGLLQQQQNVLWLEWISNAQKESGVRFSGAAGESDSG